MICDLKIRKCIDCGIDIVYNKINMRMTPYYCKECDR